MRRTLEAELSSWRASTDAANAELMRARTALEEQQKQAEQTEATLQAGGQVWHVWCVEREEAQ